MDSKRKMKRLFRSISVVEGLDILFGICLYLTIRWSDLPVPDINILEVLFVHKYKVDAAALNTVTGFITGYFVFILTVRIPDSNRKRPIRALVMEKLAVLYHKSVYLLLLMCKNCCENESEWETVITSKDIECFNDKFFYYIKRFDITSNADTILLHRGDRSPLSWSEYLYEKYDDMYKELESLFVQYQYYLDNNDLAMINMLRNSKYLDAFAGKGQQTSFLVYDDKNEYGYYDNFPISMFYTQTNKMSPIFEDNKDGENSKMLQEYVENLKELHDHLNEYKKKFGLNILHEDWACSKLKREKIGHLGTAIFKK